MPVLCPGCGLAREAASVAAGYPPRSLSDQTRRRRRLLSAIPGERGESPSAWALGQRSRRRATCREGRGSEPTNELLTANRAILLDILSWLKPGAYARSVNPMRV